VLLRRFRILIALACVAVAILASASGGVWASTGTEHRLSAEQQGRAFAIVTRQAAVARGSETLVGEVAEPFGEMPRETWERLAKVPLFRSPENGRQVVINPDVLRQLFARALGDDAARAVSIRGSLTVQRGGFVVLGEDMRRLISAYVADRAARLAGEVSVRDVSVPEAVFLPEDFSRMDVESQAELSPGRTALRLRALTADGRVLRTVPVTAFVDQWLAVPCAARPINTGDVLTPDMISHERKNVAFLKGAPVEMRPGLRAKRTIGRGLPVYAEDVEETPDVARGDIVQLVYEGRAVRLTAEAEALADGRFGETIPVRNVQSGMEIRARVVGRSTVAVR
jgi:flagella basal body P-ring formation protein FlgA